MKLYRRRTGYDMAARCQQLKEASGISGSRLPQGFYGIVSQEFGDIYVDDDVFKALEPHVRQEIDACLLRFLREDYGLITEEEKEENGERKYLGNGMGLVAMYEISIGLIRIAAERNTMISLLR